MPYTPFANTDQGLATLGKALFPDPAVIAQTGYYGAAQREKMLSGNKIMGEQALTNNWIHRIDRNGTVHFMPAPRGSPVGAPPIPATDEGTPMVGGGTYGASPGAYGAPPPPPAPSLSATVTPQAPPSGAAVSDYMNTHPNPVTSATPPPQSSPAPNSGAPPAPNTTGSDGSVPNNDAGSAVIHPGTFQAPGGGIKMAPPAQADGSPAPLAFNPTLISALGAAGGVNPNALNSTMAAYVEQEGRKSGVIDDKTADNLSSAFGNTQPLASATTIRTTGMNNATTLAQTNIQEAGSDRRKQMDIAAAVAAARAVPFKSQPGGPGTQVITTTTGEAVDKGLQPFDQASDTAARNLTSIAEPGTERELKVPVSSVPPAGTRAYSPTREAAANTYVQVVDKQTGARGRISLADFNADGGRKWMEDKVAPIPTLEMASAQTAVDAVQKNIYVPPPATIQEMKTSDLAPPRHYADGNTQLVMRTAQLYKTDDQTHGDWAASATKATQQLIAAGVLMDPKDAAADRQSWFGQPEATKPHRLQMQDPTGTKTVTYHLIDPPKLGTAVTTPSPGTTAAQPGATAAPAASTSSAPTSSANLPAYASPAPGTAPETGGLGATVITPAPVAPPAVSHPSQPPPAAPAPPVVLSNRAPPRAPLRPAAGFGVPQPLPPGAIAVAPQGAPEGAVTRASDGTMVVARGGFVYPAQPSPEMGR
jgi:hypothetical protein